MSFPQIRIHEDADGSVRASGPTTWSFGYPIETGNANAPDGVYGGWDFTDRTLTAWVDRLGFARLYYATTTDGVIVSPSIHTILAAGVDPTLDDAAMSVFLRLGFFIESDTPFINIRALPPNGALRYKQGKLTITGERRIRERQDISRDDAIDGFIDLIRQSISRRPPIGDAPGMLLSGGRDSRHIALELHRQGHNNIHAYTLDRIHRCRITDKDASELLARRLGFEHSIHTRTSRIMNASRKTHVLSNMMTDESAWLYDLILATEPKASCLYDGIGGDTLFAGLRLIPERLALARAGDVDGLTNAFLDFSRTPDDIRLRLINPADRHHYDRGVAFERTREYVKQIIEAPNPIGMFYFWSRTRTELAPVAFGFFGATPVVHAPLIDNDLYDFVASIPAELLIDGAMHTDAIARAYPEANDIPYAGGRVSVFQSTHLIMSTLIDLLDMLKARKISRSGRRRAIDAILQVAKRNTGNRLPNQLLFYLLDAEQLANPGRAAEILREFHATSPVQGLAALPKGGTADPDGSGLPIVVTASRRARSHPG